MVELIEGKLKLNVDLREEGILDFYKRVANELGYLGDDFIYDCRDIWVSNARFDKIAGTYEDRGQAGMDWLIFGPKTDESLDPDEIIIGDGFIVAEGYEE